MFLIKSTVDQVKATLATVINPTAAAAFTGLIYTTVIIGGCAVLVVVAGRIA